MFSTKKKIAAIGVSAVAVASAGIAGAYWTTSGSGSGSGATTAGVVNQLVFTQDALAPMFPGDDAQDLVVDVKNSSGESAYVTTVKAFITTDKGASCDSSNFLIDGVVAPGTAGTAVALDWTAQDLLAAASDEATGNIQFNNKATNQDLCKSAVVTIGYVAD